MSFKLTSKSTAKAEALETTARQLAALHDILQSEQGRITGMSIDVMTATKAGLDLICTLLRTGQTAKALDIAARQSRELQRAIDDLGTSRLPIDR